MWTVILLYAAGILLVIAEFVVPGLIVGTVGAILLVTSAWLGVTRFPDYTLFIIMGELVGVAGSVMVGMYLITNTRAANFLALQGVQKKEDGFVAPSEDPNLVGLLGEVHSALRPAGAIMVDGRRVDAVSAGTFIDKGDSVRVIEVAGNRVVVEKAEAGGE